MESKDLHVHTCFCDGHDEPEEIVLEALDRGMTVLGFSSHAAVPFDNDWCMTEAATSEYIRRINELKAEYAGRIRILLGTEWDYFSVGDRSIYDYIIDSVHYLPINGEMVSVDNTPEEQKAAADRFFGGDYKPLIRQYFSMVGELADKPDCRIIGHFDLISKFNEKSHAFDESDPEYVRIWQSAADKLLKSGKIFEINTGAMSRGWKTVPYPSPDIIAYIRDHGGKLILNSDCHRKENLMYAFDQFSAFVSSNVIIP